MRPRFLDPLSPLGEISSFTLISDWNIGLQANAFHMSMTTGKLSLAYRLETSALLKWLSRVSLTDLKQMPNGDHGAWHSRQVSLASRPDSQRRVAGVADFYQDVSLASHLIADAILASPRIDSRKSRSDRCRTSCQSIGTKYLENKGGPALKD